jgi:hypothetical protein
MIFYLWFFLIITTGCTASNEQPASGSDDSKVFITDRTGRKWDITHAVEQYDMEPQFFNFGIGVGAIPSVDFPVVVEKDSQEYPDSDDNISVFGVNHNGEQRAYSVRQMARHEVFNEEYPGEAETHVSVAY